MSLAVAKAEVFSVLPLHTNQISAFYIDKFDVTKALWDGVYQWAITNGYSFDYGAQGKATNHPAHTVTWHDAVKWCNAQPAQRSILLRSADIFVRNRAQVGVGSGQECPMPLGFDHPHPGGMRMVKAFLSCAPVRAPKNPRCAREKMQ